MVVALATQPSVYVVLPDNETDQPTAYTNILAGAPTVSRDDLTPIAAITINLAHTEGPDQTICADCNTPVGHHYVATSDPEEYRNTGFYVLLDGTILCEECGDPDAPAPDNTRLFYYGKCRVCGHLKGDHEPLHMLEDSTVGDRWTCDDNCDEDLNGYCHTGRL